MKAKTYVAQVYSILMIFDQFSPKYNNDLGVFEFELLFIKKNIFMGMIVQYHPYHVLSPTPMYVNNICRQNLNFSRPGDIVVTLLLKKIILRSPETRLHTQ